MLAVRTRYVALGLAVALLVAGVGTWAVVDRRNAGGSSVERTVKSVHDAHPLLLPTKIPSSWKAEANASRSFFTVTYRADADRWVRLAVAVANPPLPHPGATEKTMTFRADTKATYVVDGDSRVLRWREPGQWTPHVAGERGDAVPYELAARGVDDATFLAIAGSLRSVS